MRVRSVASLVVCVGLMAGCGWARPRFDAGNTGNNPFERTITLGNVGTLVPKFSMTLPSPNGVPDVVVARGHVFVSESTLAAGVAPGTQVFDESGMDGCSGFPRVCSPQWSLDGRRPSVVGSTLYANQSVGFDADGKVNCSGVPKACTAVSDDRRFGSPTGPVDPGKLHFSWSSDGGRGSRQYSLFGHFSPSACIAPIPNRAAPCDSPAWGRFVGGGSGTIDVGGPALADGRVFVTFAGSAPPGSTLSAFDATDAAGATLWTAALDGPAGTSVVVSEGAVIVTVATASGSRLEAFDASGVRGCARLPGAPAVCTPMWVTDPITTSGDAAPAIANGVLYRGAGSQIRAYDLHDVSSCSGTPLVCFPKWLGFVGPNVTAPAVANGLVYVSSSDGTVEAFDAAGIQSCAARSHICSGIWVINAGVAAGPVEVADAKVFVPTADGKVTAYALP